MTLRSYIPTGTFLDKFWDRTLIGVSTEEWLTAAAIVVGALLVRALFARMLVAILQFTLRRSGLVFTETDEAYLRRAFRFAILALGIGIAIRTLPLHGDWLDTARSLSRSLGAASFFAFIYCFIAPVTHRIDEWSEFVTPVMASWLIRILRAVIIMVGAAAVLDFWGIKVGPLLAGLGLFGVAVALGAQEIFKNLLSGLFIIGEHRFEPGDWIFVEGTVDGIVEKIGFRTTTVRTFDRAPVYIPNMELANKPLTNFSRRTHRRVRWLITLEYRTTVDQLRVIRDGIEKLVLDNPEFANDDTVSTTCRIEEFANSSINMLLICYTHTTDAQEFFKIREQLVIDIKKIVSDAGAGFAFPSQSIYIEQAPPVAPQPPAKKEKTA